MPAQTVNADLSVLGYLDLNKKELRNPRMQNLSTSPASPVLGQFYLDTDDSLPYYWNGSAWTAMAGGAGGIPATIFDVKGDLITATADNTPVRKAAGANGTVLFPNSAQADGLEWRAFVVGDIQTVTTDRLLGRDTTGTGVAEMLTVGGGIEFTGTGGIQRSAISGDITIAAGSGTAAIAAGVIVDGDVNASAAIAATKLAFTPTGNISSTTVQAAIAELETDLTALINSTVQGQKFKDPVDAATTTVLPNTPTYNAGAGTLTAGANAAFPTIDGVAAAVGQDYLVKDQASSFQDGIYTLTTLGSGSVPWVLTRRSDADTNIELQDAAVMIEAGTVGAGQIYTQVNAIADLTAAAQSWVLTNRNQVYAADGTTLILTGNTFSVANGGITGTQLATSVAGNGLTGGGGSALSVNVDGTTIEINADTLRIAAGAAGNGLTGGGGSALAVGAGTGIVVAADTVSVDRATTLGRVALVSSGTLTGGANSEVITHHDCGKKLVLSLCNNASPFDEVAVYHERTSNTTTTLYAASGTNLPAGYVWTVVG